VIIVILKYLKKMTSIENNYKKAEEKLEEAKRELREKE